MNERNASELSQLPEKRHAVSDRTRYAVSVLWLAGFTASAIGTALGLRPKQVLGIAQKGEWPNRGAMTDRERQVALAELKAIRYGDDGRAIDGGVLPDAAFKLRLLTATQKRTSRIDA